MNKLGTAQVGALFKAREARSITSKKDFVLLKKTSTPLKTAPGAISELD